MTDKPIPFSGPMVRAILEGRKTQTRRVLKDGPEGDWAVDPNPRGPGFAWVAPEGGISMPILPPYAPGDRLFPAMLIPSLNRNYCADLHGRIWSRARDGETWELLKGSPTSKGYLSVTPAHEGCYRTRLVHRLVAEAFYGHEPNGLTQVRHLNGDQTDNAPENLDWGTQEDNWSDRLAHGRDTGERHHAAKLTSETVKAIRAADLPQRAIAARFGIAQSTVWAIKTDRYWQEAPQPNPANCPRWASRLTLTVTDVRVQRLQDISERDAIAEGVADGGCTECGGSSLAPEGCCYNPSPDFKDSFAFIWDSLNAKPKPVGGKITTHYVSYPWGGEPRTETYRGKPHHICPNPWVSATTFTAHRCNIDQME